jgi:hypothetical protein
MPRKEFYLSWTAMNVSDEMNRPDYGVSTQTHYATEVEISQALIRACAPDTSGEGEKDRFKRERKSMVSRF